VSLILEESSERTGPLAGIRILDLTKVIMGPFATQVLADQGADVILVEESSGDINRVIGAGRHAQLSGTSMNLLRNKRSAAIDLKTIEGQELLGKLVRTCDVVVTAMRPQAVEKLHLDYATLRGITPASSSARRKGSILTANQPTSRRTTTSFRPPRGFLTSWNGCGASPRSFQRSSPTRCVA
jgi:crotonobetainyl-CoA:carnitine CoA-transferase CaiB-like acyl-CoA transferase